MALTRSMLKGMNLTEEQVSAIIDAHKETVDALKEQRDNYKAEAEKLPGVQQQLDAIKNGKDWKAEFDREHEAFEAYKKDTAGKEALATKKRLHRSILVDDLKIDKDDADLIMAGTDYNSINLNDDGTQLADTENVKKAISEKYKRYIPAIDSKGTPPATPPNGNGGGTNGDEIRKLTAKWHASKYGEAIANNEK